MAFDYSKAANAVEHHDDHELAGDDCVEDLGGTEHDMQDMRRMGKKQELRVSPCRHDRSA